MHTFRSGRITHITLQGDEQYYDAQISLFSMLSHYCTQLVGYKFKNKWKQCSRPRQRARLKTIFFESARNALTGRTGLEYAMDPRCNYCAITAVSESTSAPFQRQLFSKPFQTAYLRMNELEQILNCLNFLLCLTSPASYRAVQSSIIQGQL
jgi:hypothetical protein